VEKQRTPERVVEAAPEDLSHPDGLPCSVGSGSKRELAFSGLCRIPPAADMPPHETTREEVAVREPPAGIGRRLRPKDFQRGHPFAILPGTDRQLSRRGNRGAWNGE